MKKQCKEQDLISRFHQALYSVVREETNMTQLVNVEEEECATLLPPQAATPLLF